MGITVSARPPRRMQMSTVILPILWILKGPLPHAHLELLCSGLLKEQLGEILAPEVPADAKPMYGAPQPHRLMLRKIDSWYTQVLRLLSRECSGAARRELSVYACPSPVHNSVAR